MKPMATKFKNKKEMTSKSRQEDNIDLFVSISVTGSIFMLILIGSFVFG